MNGFTLITVAKCFCSRSSYQDPDMELELLMSKYGRRGLSETILSVPLLWHDEIVSFSYDTLEFGESDYWKTPISSFTEVRIDIPSLETALKGETIHSLLEKANVSRTDIETTERALLDEIQERARARGIELPEEYQRAILNVSLLMAQRTTEEL